MCDKHFIDTDFCYSNLINSHLVYSMFTWRVFIKNSNMYIFPFPVLMDSIKCASSQPSSFIYLLNWHVLILGACRRYQALALKNLTFRQKSITFTFSASLYSLTIRHRMSIVFVLLYAISCFLVGYSTWTSNVTFTFSLLFVLIFFG